MDLHRSNKVKIIFLFALLSLSGCKSHKIVTDTEISEKRTVTEITTKTNPYKLESISTLRVDSLGIVEPTKLKLNIGETKAEVTIKNNEITYSLENKDTVVTNKEIKDISVKEIVIKQTQSKELTTWGKIKRWIYKIAIYSLILNILFIAWKLSRLYRRLIYPL